MSIKRNCGILVISESCSLNGIGDHYTGCITIGTHFQPILDFCCIWISVPVDNTAGFLNIDIRSFIDFDLCIRLTIDFIFMMSFAEYTGNTDCKLRCGQISQFLVIRVTVIQFDFNRSVIRKNLISMDGIVLTGFIDIDVKSTADSTKCNSIRQVQGHPVRIRKLILPGSLALFKGHIDRVGFSRFDRIALGIRIPFCPADCQIRQNIIQTGCILEVRYEDEIDFLPNSHTQFISVKERHITVDVILAVNLREIQRARVIFPFDQGQGRVVNASFDPEHSQNIRQTVASLAREAPSPAFIGEVHRITEDKLGEILRLKRKSGHDLEAGIVRRSAHGIQFNFCCLSIMDVVQAEIPAHHIFGKDHFDLEAVVLIRFHVLEADVEHLIHRFRRGGAVCGLFRCLHGRDGALTLLFGQNLGFHFGLGGEIQVSHGTDGRGLVAGRSLAVRHHVNAELCAVLHGDDDLGVAVLQDADTKTRVRVFHHRDFFVRAGDCGDLGHEGVNLFLGDDAEAADHFREGGVFRAGHGRGGIGFPVHFVLEVDRIDNGINGEGFGVEDDLAVVELGAHGLLDELRRLLLDVDMDDVRLLFRVLSFCRGHDHTDGDGGFDLPSLGVEERDVDGLDLQDLAVHRVGDGILQAVPVHGRHGNLRILREGALGGFHHDFDSAGGSLPALGRHGNGGHGLFNSVPGFFVFFLFFVLFFVRGHDDNGVRRFVFVLILCGNVIRVLRQDAVADDLFVIQMVAEGLYRIAAAALDGVDGAVLFVHIVDNTHVVYIRDFIVNRVEEDQVADGGHVVPSGKEFTLGEALGHVGCRRVVRDVLGRDGGIAQAEGDKHRAPLFRIGSTVPGAVTGIAVLDPGVARIVQNGFKVVRTLAVTLLSGGDEDEVLRPVPAELQIVKVTLPVGSGLEVRVRVADGHLGKRLLFRLCGRFGFNGLLRFIYGDLFGAEALRPMDVDRQFRLVADQFPYGLITLGGVRVRTFALRDRARQFPHGFITFGGVYVRTLALRDRADQGAVSVIAVCSMLMSRILLQPALEHLPLCIAGVGVLMPRILLQPALEHLPLCVAGVGMRMRFDLRQPADERLPVIAVCVVRVRNGFRSLVCIGAVQDLPGIDLRHRRLMEAGKGPQ